MDAIETWVRDTGLPALKGALKSWSVWFSAFVAALPELLPMLQANFVTLAPYIPEGSQAAVLRWIALGILLLRLKTTTSLVMKGASK